MKKKIFSILTILFIFSCSSVVNKDHAYENYKKGIINEEIVYNTYYSNLGYITVHKIVLINRSNQAQPEIKVKSIILNKSGKVFKFDDLIPSKSVKIITEQVESIIDKEQFNPKYAGKYYKTDEAIRVDLRKAELIFSGNELIFRFPQNLLGPGIVDIPIKVK